MDMPKNDDTQEEELSKTIQLSASKFDALGLL